MEYRQLGKSVLKVSELCLGTMTFGWTADEKSTYDILSAFAEAGGNFFDTADVYSQWAPNNPGGVAETYLGNWLKNQARDKYVIATKVGGRMEPGADGEGLSRGHIMKAVEASLKRLKTDYLDLYQCHAPDENTPIEETLRAMDELVKQGKVRYIGCSNFSAWQVCKALWMSDKYNMSPFISVQPHYNLAYRAEFERELMPFCRSEQLGVITYSSLAGGFLTGKYREGKPLPAGSRTETSLVHYEMYRGYLSRQNWELINQLEAMSKIHGKSILQLALAWLLTNPVVTSPIVGVSSLAQLKEGILGAVGLRLSGEEMKRLNKITRY